MTKKVLIVDDSRLARLMIKTYLSELREGWDIIQAVDGNSALAEAEKEQFDLFFVDINMPGMDGLELIETLRERKLFGPAVIVSANVQQSIRDKAEDLNVGFVAKPITKEKVLSFLNLVGV